MKKNKKEKETVNLVIDVTVTQPEPNRIEYGPHDTINLNFNVNVSALMLDSIGKEVILENTKKELDFLFDRLEAR